jgi:guanylate kinase
MASGLMLVLSAPSGTGKTTLARRLVAECGGLFSVSATTRAPRGAERDGVDYEFVDPAEFQRRIDAGELLEWAEVHGNRYGTPARFAGEAAAGRLVVFDIDVQGGRQIQARHPEAATVLVLPPSLGELERRLRGRATDSEESIARRLAMASAEVNAGLASYDYALVNDDLEEAYARLAALVRALRGEGSPGDRRVAESLRITAQDLTRFRAG